jgi:hypothetical protein
MGAATPSQVNFNDKLEMDKVTNADVIRCVAEMQGEFKAAMSQMASRLDDVVSQVASLRETPSLGA